MLIPVENSVVVWLRFVDKNGNYVWDIPYRYEPERGSGVRREWNLVTVEKAT